MGIGPVSRATGKTDAAVDRRGHPETTAKSEAAADGRKPTTFMEEAREMFADVRRAIKNNPSGPPMDIHRDMGNG